MVRLLGLSSGIIKRNSVSGTSAFGPKDTGETHFICILTYFQSQDGLRDRFI